MIQVLGYLGNMHKPGRRGELALPMVKYTTDASEIQRN